LRVLRRIVPLQVLEELPADGEGASADVDLRFPRGEDVALSVHQKLFHMLGVVRRADDGHCTAFRDLRGGGEHRGAAETVADEELRRPVVLPQVSGRGQQVFDVRAEIGVGEIAAAHAQAGEVEAQHRDAARGKRLADVGCGLAVLRAGEAVGEKRVGARLGRRQLEPGGQLVALGSGEADGFGRHGQ
jgi:hypothetical protein